jgi:hypothetical protein
MILRKLVPDDFEVPTKLETDKFRLRTLTINDVDKDYDAVMSSINHVHGVFGPEHDWPTKELTHEQDLIDLGWHQKEFQNRTSFAFTMMSLDESECLGCVYFYPSENPNYDVKVILWVRDSRKELDQELFETVKEWLKEWPFKKPGFPGRTVSWDDWN